MSEMDAHYFEAERISRYLTGRLPGEREKIIYAKAMQKLDIQSTTAEAELWSRMLRSQFRMSIADAGLALLKPDSVLRRKIYTLLAILEASPAYTPYFLSDSSAPFFMILLAGARALGRAAAGSIMLKIWWRECC